MVRLAALSLIAVGLVLAQLAHPPSAHATELLLDGGFEASSGGDSPSWTEADSVFGTPICDASCGGVAGPRSGTWWAWFGGAADASTSSLQQTVTIPAGGATLSFYLWISSTSIPLTATLTVKMDTTVVHTFTEVAGAGYTLRTFDISPFADGGSHALSFSFSNPDSRLQASNFDVDDVSISTGGSTPTATPTVTVTDPPSPSSVASPKVLGTAEADSTVSLYNNATCSGSPLGSGPASDFEGTGILAPVVTNTTTTIYAMAAKPAQPDSACSSTFATYVHDSVAPPEPTVSSVTPASPGTSTSPVVSGSAEAGTTVDLYSTEDCLGPPSATGSAADFASPGLTVTVAPDSSTVFKATATDQAGNSSACSLTSVAYTHDAAPAPVTSIVVTPSSPGTSLIVAITGDAEPASTVDVYTTSTCSGFPVVTGSEADFDSPGLMVFVDPDSTTEFRATATDAAGNTSGCSSDSATYVNDSTWPDPVNLGSVTPASPGTSTEPVVKGTAEAGSTVNLYTTSDCSGSPAKTGTAESFASTGFGVLVGADSTTTFTATATDQAGNTSLCSASSVTYVNDSTSPGPVTLTGVTPASPGSSTTLAVKGTAEAGSTVRLYATSDCSGSPAATGTAATFPSPGIPVTVATDSTTIFKATATDLAGNTSACSTDSVAYVNDSTAPAVTVSSVTPASPSASTTPAVKGTAEAGSTVKLYGTSDCSGSPAATGTAAAFQSSGLPVTVATGSTTTYRATATDQVGNTSACSTSSVTYTQHDPAPPAAPTPDTTLTKTPPTKVKTTKKKAKVSFEFSSTVASATFECSIDSQAFTACTSGQTFKLKIGKHTCAVRAVVAGVTDPTPATSTVKVKRKKKH